MEWQNEALRDDGQTYSNVEDRPKMQLAIPITTPRKGPLVLATTANEHSRKKLSVSQQTNAHYLPRQRYLNRLPVPDVQRPIEAIEKNLGYLSLAELRQQVLMDQTSPRFRPHPVLPTFDPLMKYSAIGSNYLTANTDNCRTLQAGGHMDIQIRYSRHATPTTFLPSQARTYPPTHVTSNTYSQAWTYPPPTASLSITIPPLREMSNVTNQTDAPKRTQDDRELVNETDYLRPAQGNQNRPFVRPTIAPHSIHASAIHRIKPITANTILKGQGLMFTSPLLCSRK